MYNLISRVLIFVAYYLDDSRRYKKVKHFCVNMLTNDKHKNKKHLDIFMISIVLMSIYLIIYEVNHPLTDTLILIEHIILLILLGEYLARVWVCSSIRAIIIDMHEESEFLGVSFDATKAIKEIVLSKLRYMRTPMAIIDLLAILPTFTALRIFRIFMVFRLFKLFRHIANIGEFTKIIVLKKFEFVTVGMLIGFFALLFATAMFFFEGGGQNHNVHGFFDAVYWTFVTMATVGYGDISPVTQEGRVIAILLMLFGVGLISLITSIMVSAFSEKLDELKLNRVKNQIYTMKDYIILCGYSHITEVIAHKLHKTDKKFIIIDVDETRIQLAKKQDYIVLQVDATSSDNLKDAGVGYGAHTIIALTKDDITNLYITITARDIDKNIKIISKANTKNFKKKLLQAGADDVFYPYESGIMLLKEYIGQPVAFEALYGMISGHKDVYMDDIAVYNNDFFVGKELSNLNLSHYKIVLLGIVRNTQQSETSYSFKNKHFVFNPPENEVLQENDILIVLANHISLRHYKHLIQRSK